MAYTDIDDPTAYFQANLHSGDGGTGQTLTFDGNSDLQLDLHWGKCRSEGGREWQVIDTVRGITKGLTTVTTAAEYTESTYVTAIGSNGYSIGQNNDNNKADETYVSYNWKAGTSFTNDASGTGIGDIDSAGSVSDVSGFSICSYSGSGTSGHTIKHGLNTAPKIIIIKKRSGADNWTMLNTNISLDTHLHLNTTDAAVSDPMFTNTAPTTSVFTVDSDGQVNESGNTFIAYCFSEVKGYSKFGTYEGNGNDDGPFIYTGFAPAFVMVKCFDQGEHWNIYDNKRGASAAISPNLENAERTMDDSPAMELLSNGFKIRTSDANLSNAADGFIYMAFAENPFVTSTGVPATAR